MIDTLIQIFTGTTFWFIFSICLIVLFLLRIFIFRKQEGISVSPDLYDSEMDKADAVITSWIKDENLDNAMVIELASFRGTFLGKLANINFKSLLLDAVDEKDKTIENVEYQTVEQQLDTLLKDYDEIRSYSHFLDLVRKLYIEIDTSVLELRKQRYFMGYGVLLGNTPYTHTEKQIAYIANKYPWLWILEYISNHSLVQNQLLQNQSIVETDKSKEMNRSL